MGIYVFFHPQESLEKSNFVCFRWILDGFQWARYALSRYNTYRIFHFAPKVLFFFQGTIRMHRFHRCFSRMLCSLVHRPASACIQPPTGLGCCSYTFLHSRDKEDIINHIKSLKAMHSNPWGIFYCMVYISLCCIATAHCITLQSCSV